MPSNLMTTSGGSTPSLESVDVREVLLLIFHATHNHVRRYTCTGNCVEYRESGSFSIRIFLLVVLPHTTVCYTYTISLLMSLAHDDELPLSARRSRATGPSNVAAAGPSPPPSAAIRNGGNGFSPPPPPPMTQQQADSATTSYRSRSFHWYQKRSSIL